MSSVVADSPATPAKGKLTRAQLSAVHCHPGVGTAWIFPD